MAHIKNSCKSLVVITPTPMTWFSLLKLPIMETLDSPFDFDRTAVQILLISANPQSNGRSYVGSGALLHRLGIGQHDHPALSILTQQLAKDERTVPRRPPP